MNKSPLFFLPLFLCVTLNGMSDKSTETDNEQINHDVRLDTLEAQLSQAACAYHKLVTRVQASESYLIVLATLQANQAREAERIDIQKKLKKVERVQQDLKKSLHNKKLTKSTQAKLDTLEQLTTELEFLQDKLHALEEPTPE